MPQVLMDRVKLEKYITTKTLAPPSSLPPFATAGDATLAWKITPEA